MSKSTKDGAGVVEALEALRAEVARLSERVAALETGAGAATKPSKRPTTVAEGISEEQVIAVSAAVAAYLGLKPRIRQIRLLRSAGWAQQGRLTIQASHRLTRSER